MWQDTGLQFLLRERDILPGGGGGGLLISQRTSAILSEIRMMETSTSPEVVQRRKNSRRTNRQHYLLWVMKQSSCLVEYQHSVELFGSITGCFNEILEQKNRTGTYAISDVPIGKVESKFFKLRKQLKRKQKETTLCYITNVCLRIVIVPYLQPIVYTG